MFPSIEFIDGEEQLSRPPLPRRSRSCRRRQRLPTRRRRDAGHVRLRSDILQGVIVGRRGDQGSGDHVSAQCRGGTPCQLASTRPLLRRHGGAGTAQRRPWLHRPDRQGGPRTIYDVFWKDRGPDGPRAGLAQLPARIFQGWRTDELTRGCASATFKLVPLTDAELPRGTPSASRQRPSPFGHQDGGLLVELIREASPCRGPARARGLSRQRFCPDSTGKRPWGISCCTSQDGPLATFDEVSRLPFVTER